MYRVASLLAIGLLNAPAQAGQIVSNLTETYNFGAGLGGVWVEASSFTTGAQSYSLNSVTLDLQVNSQGTVALSLFNDSGGLPGTSLENLGTQFINASGGDYDTAYPASGATLLQANTRYWLVVQQVGAGSIQWVSTYSTAETSPSGVTIGNDMYYRSVGGTTWTAQASATDTGQFAVNATSGAGTAYNLVGYYHRDESFNPGKLYSFAFRAGTAQGCPGPTYTQPCYNPAGPSPGGTWVAANGVATDLISAGQPTWTWNGTTLTSTGTFWGTAFVLSNPNGAPLLSDKVTDLTITPSTSTSNAASYECVEGAFYASVAMSGCKFTVLGSNLLDDSSANWNVGANPKCVTMTIGGDDYSAFDGSPGVPGTPSPRGLTAQAAGQAGVGCAQTSAGPIGTSGAFDLWNVVVDDGTNLILANTTNIGACYLFGSGPTPACPDDVALAGISYLVLVKASAPDGDSDGVPDATDNCPVVPNTGQADADADGVGDVCDNCQLVYNPGPGGAQCDSDADGYGNRCDGDLNNNGSTNAFDSAQFRTQLGLPSVAPTYNKADLNCNGAVNAFDAALFRTMLGLPPGPSGLACAGTVPCP